VIADADGMRHFQEARVLFETGLVRDVARHATAADIGRLRDALAANGEAIGDVRRFEESDMAFHYAIATTPKNPIYAVLHQALIEWLVDQRRVTLSYPGQNRVAYNAHAAIFEAIAARDPGEADARMRSHLAQVSDLYWKVRGARQ
jgi:GntR family transcriptional repressor for pyruvate dehydrogenase complex